MLFRSSRNSRERKLADNNPKIPLTPLNVRLHFISSPVQFHTPHTAHNQRLLFFDLPVSIPRNLHTRFVTLLEPDGLIAGQGLAFEIDPQSYCPGRLHPSHISLMMIRASLPFKSILNRRTIFRDTSTARCPPKLPIRCPRRTHPCTWVLKPLLTSPAKLPE